MHITGDSKWGGGGAIILALGEMAQRRGWQVDMLTTDPVCQEQVSRHGFGVVELDVIWRDIRPWKDLRGLLRLVRYLRKSDYHLVHTHTSKAGFVGRVAARLAGIPGIIHTVHGFAFHEGSSGRTIIAYSILEKIAAYCCDYVVTVSDFHRDWAARLRIAAPPKLISIPNGIDAERLAPARSRESIRAEWNSGPNEVVLLSTGRLAEGKGLTLLLEALPFVIARADRPVKLVLAGEGPLRAELERLIPALNLHDNVLLLGFRTDLGDMLNGADIVALPSVREGLSISLLEAMACGKPIVATTIGSNREATAEGEAAFLVPPNDRSALERMLLYAIQHPEEARAKARVAQSRFESHYTRQRMVASYAWLYEELVRRARG